MGELALPSAADRAARRARAKAIVQSVIDDEEMPMGFPWPPGGPDSQAIDVETLVFDMAHEAVLENEQLAFIAHMALTAAQTAVPYEAKQQMLREISAACRGEFPDWWDRFKKEHKLDV